MFRPARITSSTSSSWDAITGLKSRTETVDRTPKEAKKRYQGKNKKREAPHDLPRVYDLALHRVVIKNTLHLWVNWFSRVLVQPHNVPFVMLCLKRNIQFRFNEMLSSLVSERKSLKERQQKEGIGIFTVRAIRTSCVSRPELSASVLGITRRASANACTPSCARCQ